jgi:hypothetical protein
MSNAGRAISRWRASINSPPRWKCRCPSCFPIRTPPKLRHPGSDLLPDRTGSAFVDILLVEDNPVDDVALTLAAFKRARFLNSIASSPRMARKPWNHFFGRTGDCGSDPARTRNRHCAAGFPIFLKLSGIEVLRRLKADPRTAKIPVVLLTASEEASRISQFARNWEPPAYISKPVNLQGLSKITPELCLVWALIKPVNGQRWLDPKADCGARSRTVRV